MLVLPLILALLAFQDPPACEKCGRPVLPSTIRWEATPTDAARKAKADEKLVFVVHTGGGRIDPRGAFTNAELGAYVQKYFVSACQRVPTAAPRGAVVSYFCAPDGRVLHAVVGPVDAATLLAEAKWAVEASKKCIDDSRASEVPFKALFRKAHAERLRTQYGLVVEPVTFDAVEPGDDAALVWRDPAGRPVAPPLVMPPLDGPDVQFGAMAKAQEDGIPDRRGRGWHMGPQARVHQLLAAHALVKIERIYATVFQVLGQRIEDRPWNPIDPTPKKVCLGCREE